jgi:hypothetical protein
MSGVPRDPEYYHPTTHAIQQRRERDIEWPWVSQAIADGELRTSHKPNCWLFITDVPFEPNPVYCVASEETGEIVTIGWRE